MSMIAVSVILPTYNRLDRLKRVLSALERQECPRDDFEVVIVSDGSTDGTNEHLKSMRMPFRTQLVLQANHGAAVARNQGLAAADGRLALFLDDDVVPAPDLIAEHARTHAQNDERTVVLGPMLTPDDFAMQPWVRWEQAMLAKQYGDMVDGRWQPTARQFYTGNTSLLRRHILEAGGFDPAFRRAEDVELAYRLAERGLHFVFNPRAVGYHYAERSFRSWMDIAYAYGRNDVIFWRDKGQAWLLPNLLYEMRGRNLLIRLLARACLDRRRSSALAIGFLTGCARASAALRLAPVTRMAYSGIFNLRNYQGVSDELGGRRALYAQAARATTPSGPPAQETRRSA
jgi:GT2 family glycosyltransferase